MALAAVIVAAAQPVLALSPSALDDDARPVGGDAASALAIALSPYRGTLPMSDVDRRDAFASDASAPALEPDDGAASDAKAMDER